MGACKPIAGGDTASEKRAVHAQHEIGSGRTGVAVAVLAGLVWAIAKTKSLQSALPQIEPVTVQRIGELLMTNYVWPLQCVGVLLTAALIGALILVMEEKS